MKINKKAERYMMDENKNKNRYISFTLNLISRRQRKSTLLFFLKDDKKIKQEYSARSNVY